MAAEFDRLTALIARHWGYRTLRPLQAEAMEAVLDRRDSLVVLPTGAGKSLCFQAPALLDSSAPTVVLSPLIALMKDQVDALRTNDIPARFINSSLTDRERQETFADLKAGRVPLLFVSPERLAMPDFRQYLISLNVRTFAIDEAHCISHWGHDFRPEYRQIAELRAHFPQARFHAYTATATQRVREDIAVQLGLVNPLVLVGNFDRPNLRYRVRPKKDSFGQIREILERHPKEAGIIYCISRRAVDDTTVKLQNLGVNARPYHAGLSDNTRKATQDAFKAGKCDVVVATVAFGMGIDRSDVRFVLHAGMPKSIEHYQQEAGRAGRDGLEAECVLFHSPGHILTWKKLLSSGGSDGVEVDPEYLKEAYDQLERINRYASAHVCRHKALVEHFGQKFESENCRACDVCLQELPVEAVADCQTIARKILSCVARTEERFGGGHVAAVLCGEADERISRLGHDKLTTFGLLKEYPKLQVRDWINQLIDAQLLEQSAGDYPTLKLNDAGREVMKNLKQASLIRKLEAPKESRRSQSEEVSWEGVDRDLFDLLRDWRLAKAGELARPPYTILHDTSLRELARIRPSNPDRLAYISGFGEAKLRAFGDEILKIVRDYCDEKGVARDVKGATSTVTKPRLESTASAIKAYPYFRGGESIEGVMAHLSLARSTVTGYLAQYIRDNRPVDLSPWVSEETRKRVEAAIAIHGLGFLRPLFVELKEQVPYDEIKLVTANAV